MDARLAVRCFDMSHTTLRVHCLRIGHVAGMVDCATITIELLYDTSAASLTTAMNALWRTAQATRDVQSVDQPLDGMLVRVAICSSPAPPLTAS